MGSLDQNHTIRYANNSIVNPIVPCKHVLRQLHIGEMIFVRGYVPPKSQVFMINLQFDLGNGKADNLLHISARFKEKVIVRNSLLSGRWGPEDRHNGMGSLKQNQFFECCILVHQNHYRIAFNRQHFCVYRHRAPYGSVNQLHVTGSVQLHATWSQPPPPAIHHLTSKAMPPLPKLSSPTKKPTNGQGDAAQRLFGYNVPMPFHHILQEGLRTGSVLYICGVPAQVGKSFSVTLKTSASFGERDYICQLRVAMDTRSIVCKAEPKLEENLSALSPFPFQKGVTFDLLITCHPEYFNFSLNNTHLLQLRDYKGELSRIRRLDITGDIKLVHIRMM